MTRVLIYLNKTQSDFVSKIKLALDKSLENPQFIMAEDLVEFKTLLVNEELSYILVDSLESIDLLYNVETNIVFYSSESIDLNKFSHGQVTQFDNIKQLLSWFPAAKLSIRTRDTRGIIKNNKQEPSNIPLGQTEAHGDTSKNECTKKLDSVVEASKNVESNQVESSSDDNKSKSVSTPSTQEEKGDIPEKTLHNEVENFIDQVKEDSYPGQKNKSVKYENSLKISERAIEIRKRGFSRAKWDRNKTIGIWSPIPRIGVTTFTMNFSIFLGKHRVQCATLEGLNEHHVMKTILKRFTNTPVGWNSYANALHNEDSSSENISWPYNGVYWIPLDDNDIESKWDQDILYHYINNVKYFDVVLIDLPTGELEAYTEHTLDHLDELWVLVDDSFHQIAAWKKYIHKQLEKYKLPAKLIFNRQHSFSQMERLSKELEIPLITSIPSLSVEAAKNNYENVPLLEHKEIYEKLKLPYTQLAQHVVGNSFEADEYKTKWFAKLKTLITAR
ncbi:hypothetical protein ACQKFO_21190 [Rossellomorea sp. NPDC071047]|uniref:hypothetical protein n=1 Tax=Rossellomorea sp. NPDC071047 TaxID=3390675 RepID=UPI003D056563